MNALVYTVEETADLLKIGRWKVFELLRENKIRSVKIGSSRRIPATAVDEYIARLLEEVA